MITKKPILLPLTLLFLLSGCSSAANVETPEPNNSLNASENNNTVVVPEDDSSPSGRLTSLFEEKVTLNDANAIAQGIADSGLFELSLEVMEVEPGDLSGFTNQIQNFAEGAMFSPMIGSIPFVGYIFHTSNPELLVEELEKSYDLRWNICTEAEEYLVRTSGDYVMFVMFSQSQFKA